MTCPILLTKYGLPGSLQLMHLSSLPPIICDMLFHLGHFLKALGKEQPEGSRLIMDSPISTKKYA